MWNPVQMGFFPETFCLVEFVFVQGFCLFGVWVLLGVFCLVLFVCLLFLLLFVYFGGVFLVLVMVGMYFKILFCLWIQICFLLHSALSLGAEEDCYVQESIGEVATTVS